MNEELPRKDMSHDFHHELLSHFIRWSVAVAGGAVTYLAQFTPKEVEGWMQLGGIAITIAGMGWAIKYLIKKNEEKDGVIQTMLGSVEVLRDKAEQKLAEERLRLELKWDAERRENLEHREKDRETRDKFADAVEKLSEAIKPLAKGD